MNRFIFFSLLCVALASLPGCGRKGIDQAEATPLDTAFTPDPAASTPSAAPPPIAIPTTAPAVQAQAAAVRAEIRSGNLLDAGTRVRQMQAATNLTGPQLEALHETAIQIQQRLIERAATGDPEAKRQWEAYQKSLAR